MLCSRQRQPMGRLLGDPAEWIRSILAVPYRELGRDRNGLDCLGLCLLYYKEMFALEFPDPHTLDADAVMNSPFMDHFIRVNPLVDHCAVEFMTPESGVHLGIHYRRQVIQTTSRHGVLCLPLSRMGIACLGGFVPKVWVS